MTRSLRARNLRYSGRTERSLAVGDDDDRCGWTSRDTSVSRMSAPRVRTPGLVILGGAGLSGCADGPSRRPHPRQIDRVDPSRRGRRRWTRGRWWRPKHLRPMHWNRLAHAHAGGWGRGHQQLLLLRGGGSRRGDSNLRLRPGEPRFQRPGPGATRAGGARRRFRGRARGRQHSRTIRPGGDLRRWLHFRGLRRQTSPAGRRDRLRRSARSVPESARSDRGGHALGLTGQHREPRLPPGGEGRLGGADTDRRHPGHGDEQQVLSR